MFFMMTSVITFSFCCSTSATLLFSAQELTNIRNVAIKNEVENLYMFNEIPC
jgi:hypothetical protein